MPSRLTRLAALVASVAMILTVAIPAAAADSARVRVLHASPDAPNVDIYLDDARIEALTNVPFKTISGYLVIPAGSHNVKVVPTGGEAADAVIDADVNFAAGTSYTVAATNVVASIEVKVVVDAPPSSTSAGHLRVVHFSADTPAVDIRPDGGDPIVTNLSYPDATGYLDLPAGSYDLEVCATGTDTCPLDLDPVTVANGTSYSAFAVGSLTGGTLTAVLAVDSIMAPETDVLEPATANSGSIGLAVVALATVAVLALMGALRWMDRRTAR